MANIILWNIHKHILVKQINDYQNKLKGIIKRKAEPETFPKEAMDSIKPSKAGKGDFP